MQLGVAQKRLGDKCIAAARREDQSTLRAQAERRSHFSPRISGSPVPT